MLKDRAYKQKINHKKHNTTHTQSNTASIDFNEQDQFLRPQNLIILDYTGIN